MRSKMGLAVLAGVAATATAYAAEDQASYGQLLARVYWTYESVLGNKEACHEASPATRGAIDRAYAGWRGRNAKTVAELDEWLTRMIRRESKDEKEYARNIGKYEGALLQQRSEIRQAALNLARADLELLCKSLPQFLGSRENDLDVLYAEELKRLRARQ